MNAVVTGGAGFIGSSIARALADRGDEVVVVDNLLTGRREAVPPKTRFVEIDIRDPDGLREVFSGQEVVFHQAAIRSVPKSIDDPLLTNSCNVEGTLSVLKAATESGVRRVVYASSSSVYGDTGGVPNSEDLPTRPKSPYAVSKLAGENYCRVWDELGLISTISLRYFNVFGPGQHPESKYSAVFPGFVSALLSGKAPVVHWDGEQSRDFTYIDDVVQANLLAAEAPSLGAENVLNVASGRPKSVNEVLASVSKAVGHWIEPHTAPRRDGDIRSTAADLTRISQALGWKAQTDWTTAVERTVQGFTTSG